MLAAFTSICYFRFALEGHQFQLWTDHKPLLVALHRLSEPWTPRQQRQLAFIDEFSEMSSSYPVSPMSWQTRFPSHWTLWCATWLQMFLDYHCLAADQLLYLEVAALCANSSLHFSTQHMDGCSILGTFRPVVPQSFRQHVFETIHNTPTRA